MSERDSQSEEHMFTFRDLDYGQVMDHYAGGQEDHHQPQKSQQGAAKRLKGGVLPAYCDPPNPCPKGYTAEDGCIEMDQFENKAEFSRKYQAAQSCMCDSEHMFSCPDMYSQHQVRNTHQPTSPSSSSFLLNLNTLLRLFNEPIVCLSP